MYLGRQLQYRSVLRGVREYLCQTCSPVIRSSQQTVRKFRIWGLGLEANKEETEGKKYGHPESLQPWLISMLFTTSDWLPPARSPA